MVKGEQEVEDDDEAVDLKFCHFFFKQFCVFVSGVLMRLGYEIKLLGGFDSYLSQTIYITHMVTSGLVTWGPHTKGKRCDA